MRIGYGLQLMGVSSVAVEPSAKVKAAAAAQVPGHVFGLRRSGMRTLRCFPFGPFLTIRETPMSAVIDFRVTPNAADVRARSGEDDRELAVDLGQAAGGGSSWSRDLGGGHEAGHVAGLQRAHEVELDRHGDVHAVVVADDGGRAGRSGGAGVGGALIGRAAAGHGAAVEHVARVSGQIGLAGDTTGDGGCGRVELGVQSRA